MPESAMAPARRPPRPRDPREFEGVPKWVPRKRDGTPDKRSREWREWTRARSEIEPASSKVPAEMPEPMPPIFPMGAEEEEELPGEEFGEEGLPAKMSGEGKVRKRKYTGKTERQRIHRSGQLKPATFKSFISSLIKQFDDSRVLRRL